VENKVKKPTQSQDGPQRREKVDLVPSDLVLPDLVRTDLVHASLDLAIPDMHCNFHIHDLNLQDDPDHSFEGPLNHLSSVHKIQKRSVREENVSTTNN